MYHPSVKEIKENFNVKEKFTFREVTVNEVEQIIMVLLEYKVAGGDIPLKFLKQSSSFSLEELRYCINYAFS